MAKITAYPAMAVPIFTDILPIVDDPGGTPATQKVTVKALTNAMVVALQTGLTSTSWDGDAHSTTAKTLIDLSAVFTGVPANVSAVLVRAMCRDFLQAPEILTYILSCLRQIQRIMAHSGNRVSGQVNDYWREVLAIVPCNASGDIYYQIAASGANTFDVYLEIWGWWI